MSNLKAYLSILIFMDLMFIITGQITTTSPGSVLLNAILDPSNIKTSSFWIVLIGATGIGALATLAGFAIGFVSRAGISVLGFVVIATSMALLVGDFVSIFLYLRNLNAILATIIMAPLIILYILTVVEWLKR